MHANLLTGIDHSTSPLNLVDQSQSLSDQPAPPSRFTLQAFSKSTAGRILGSYTTKAIGGFLIGLGLAFSWTGLGIGLVAAGAVIWIASTAVSTAGLEQPDLIQVASHLCVSVFFGITGMYGGVLNFGIGAAPLAALPPNLISVGGGLQYFSLVAPALDFHSSKKAKPNPVSQLNDEYNLPKLAEPKPTDQEVIKQINNYLAQIYQQNNDRAVVFSTASSGQSVTLQIGEWLDHLVDTGHEAPSGACLAILRNVNPVTYELIPEIIYDRFMTDLHTGKRVTAKPHPRYGVTISDETTIRGEKLVVWLNSILQHMPGTT